MSDPFTTPHRHYRNNNPISDDELRRAMAAQFLATSQPTISQDELMAAIEQKKDEMVLPSPSAIGCVFFDSGGQRWGVRLNDIERIIAAHDLAPAPVPDSPPWLLGIFHIDLEIASFIDLSRFLNAAIPERRRQNVAVLIARQSNAIFGLKVSRLSFASLIEERDLTYVAPTDISAAMPYLFATYTPQSASDPEAARAAGILNMRLIATSINAQLEEERNPRV